MLHLRFRRPHQPQPFSTPRPRHPDVNHPRLAPVPRSEVNLHAVQRQALHLVTGTRVGQAQWVVCQLTYDPAAFLLAVVWLGEVTAVSVRVLLWPRCYYVLWLVSKRYIAHERPNRYDLASAYQFHQHCPRIPSRWRLYPAHPATVPIRIDHLPLDVLVREDHHVAVLTQDRPLWDVLPLWAAFIIGAPPTRG